MKFSLNLNSLIAFLAIPFLIVSCSESDQKTVETTTSDSLQTSASAKTSSSDESDYIDLNTGQKVRINYDSVAFITTDVNSGNPIQFYVNTITSDTFDTKGRLVNNALLRVENGWQLDEARMNDNEKYKSGDLKIKTKGDEIKIKTDDAKMKSDGDKSKLKTDDVKIKNDQGDIKIKDK